ncbi:MAG: hypothetical protein ACP5PK_03740 [candidate division WOR-3 bacterium]
MARLPAIGKISAAVFNELIFPHLGAKRGISSLDLNTELILE